MRASSESAHSPAWWAPAKALLSDGISQLGIPLDDRATDRLIDYLALLERWGKVFNLTAVRNPSDMVRSHVLDSLAVIPAIEESLSDPPRAIVDVGSGAGLPGLVLALTRPELNVHLVEPVGKKVAFLEQCRATFDLRNVRVHPNRVEAVAVDTLGGADVIICRAFASLEDFVRKSVHLADHETWFLAMKGARATEEASDYVPVPLMVDNQEVVVRETTVLNVPSLDSTRALVRLRASPTVDSGHASSA